jgi:hypothetical protein
MSSSMNIDILGYHKFLRNKLSSLNISSYEDASKLINDFGSEKVTLNGKTFTLSIIVDVYPPDDEIVVAVYIERKKILCDEGHSQGYLFRKNKEKSILSQKKLWDYGY